jgi:hypothetical protein
VAEALAYPQLREEPEKGALTLVAAAFIFYRGGEGVASRVLSFFEGGDGPEGVIQE